MIVFRNPGVIDVRSITTFGVSSKEKAGAIGFFGTGLKYAIAILLREGCSVTIFTGGKRLEFGTSREQIRVDEFELVTMNGQPLGFTTELGKTWELWCAFRELYCNCMDEDGTMDEVKGRPERFEAPDDETIVMVSGEKFKDVWAARSEIILSREPTHKHETAHVLMGHSPHVFYRGVRAAKLAQPSLYTYNVQRRLDLTEDRTVKYMWEVSGAVVRALMECDDRAIIDRAVRAPEGTFEHGLAFSGVVPSDTFLDVVRGHIQHRTLGVSPSAKETCRIFMMDKLMEDEAADLSPLDTARLDKAVRFCERIGFPVRTYPIKAVEFLGEGMLGCAHDNQILVSRRVFMMGTKMLAGTLIEEYIHLFHRCSDETREMQNILMDTICGLGEQITGEPL